MRECILVTDGEQRSALATVRSLGRAGFRVLVSSARARSIAGASRFAATQFKTADPLRQPATFADDVAHIVDEHGVDLILPVSEAAFLALLPVRDQLHAPIPVGSLEQFRAICDKRAVLEVAREFGIATPSQVVIEQRADVSAGLRAVKYPVVLKPTRSISAQDASAEKNAVRHAATVDELRKLLDALPDSAYPVMLQQRIVGPGIGVFVIIWNDEVIATFFHRRLREKPPSGGVSVFRESTEPDDDLLRRSLALLHAMQWQGAAMVEYKVDEASGTPYLMEINGRFWGSLQLAIDAGVDFPVLLVEAALGRKPMPVTSYNSARSRWLWGDVDHLIARMRHSAEDLGLPPGAPSRARALIDFARGFGTQDEVARLSDMRPAFREFLDWIQRR